MSWVDSNLSMGHSVGPWFKATFRNWWIVVVAVAEALALLAVTEPTRYLPECFLDAIRDVPWQVVAVSAFAIASFTAFHKVRVERDEVAVQRDAAVFLSRYEWMLTEIMNRALQTLNAPFDQTWDVSHKRVLEDFRNLLPYIGRTFPNEAERLASWETSPALRVVPIEDDESYNERNIEIDKTAFCIADVLDAVRKRSVLDSQEPQTRKDE